MVLFILVSVSVSCMAHMSSPFKKTGTEHGKQRFSLSAWDCCNIRLMTFVPLVWLGEPSSYSGSFAPFVLERTIFFPLVGYYFEKRVFRFFIVLVIASLISFV